MPSPRCAPRASDGHYTDITPRRSTPGRQPGEPPHGCGRLVPDHLAARRIAVPSSPPPAGRDSRRRSSDGRAPVQRTATTAIHRRPAHAGRSRAGLTAGPITLASNVDLTGGTTPPRTRRAPPTSAGSATRGAPAGPCSCARCRAARPAVPAASSAPRRSARLAQPACTWSARAAR